MSQASPRFGFGPFVLSPAQRRLLKDGRDLPLIPRYFDLLLLLVEQRGLLVLAGGRMAGASLDLIAGRIQGAVLPLQPLADLLGEPTPGRITYLVQGVYEGLLFGAGLGYGPSRRPR